MNLLNLLDHADKLALLETFIQVVKDETLRDHFGEILELNNAELFRIRDLAEKIMKAECETSASQPDEGNEIELRPDQYSDNFEDETRRYIESALAVELDDRDITEDLHNIMDIVAGIGERHFGIPEMHLTRTRSVRKHRLCFGRGLRPSMQTISRCGGLIIAAGRLISRK